MGSHTSKIIRVEIHHLLSLVHNLTIRSVLTLLSSQTKIQTISGLLSNRGHNSQSPSCREHRPLLCTGFCHSSSSAWLEKKVRSSCCTSGTRKADKKVSFVMWDIKGGLICKLPQQNMIQLTTPAHSKTCAQLANSLQEVWKSWSLEPVRIFQNPCSRVLQIDRVLTHSSALTFPLKPHSNSLLQRSCEITQRASYREKRTRFPPSPSYPIRVCRQCFPVQQWGHKETL